MILCEFGCGKEATHMFKSSNRWACSINFNSCEARRKKDSERKRGKNPFEGKVHPKGMLGKSHPFKGKTYEEIYDEERSKLFREICRNTAKKHIAGKPHSSKTKKRLSEHAYRRHSDGWDNKAGRCKKYKYFSEIAGDITVDGTWELRTAMWLDDKKFNWKRNKTRFEYIHLNGNISHYTPDFWVEELGGYLEIKGYETELDRCKWSQFNHKLIVWKKKELKQNGVLP